ncbi:MAG: ABC transporter ATP-binding protein [Deltaproteobacteria bacterium]|nr:MAG: ABC transporter ATP-binding protein [Deltaproteobacteria bacterium]
MIQLQQLNHFYGHFHSLHDINIDIPKGSITGLIGPNGAGKSTLMKILAGFLVPSQGIVTVAGIPVQKRPLEARKKVGYMPETPALYRELRVEEYLDFVSTLKGLSQEETQKERPYLIDCCGLEKILKKLIGGLSKGNRQRVALAQALIGSPEVILLDEPTSALDPAQVMDIRNFIKGIAGQKTVLMSSHILSEIAQICDRIVFIRDGRVVFLSDPKADALGLSQTQLEALFEKGIL